MRMEEGETLLYCREKGMKMMFLFLSVISLTFNNVELMPFAKKSKSNQL